MGSTTSPPGPVAAPGHSGEEGITKGVYIHRAAVAPEACSAQDSMDKLFACDDDAEVEIFRELEWDRSLRYLQTSQ